MRGVVKGDVTTTATKVWRKHLSGVRYLVTQETAITSRRGGNRVVRGVVKGDVATTATEVWRRELSGTHCIVTQKTAIKVA